MYITWTVSDFKVGKAHVKAYYSEFLGYERTLCGIPLPPLHRIMEHVSSDDEGKCKSCLRKESNVSTR